MNVNAYEKQLRSKYMNVLGPPGNFRGDLKISNQNTLGGGDLSKELNLGGGVKFKEGPKIFGGL